MIYAGLKGIPMQRVDDHKIDRHCDWDFPKSSNEFPFESLSSGYSDVFNVKKTRMQFPDFLGFRPRVFYLLTSPVDDGGTATEAPRKCERFSRETTKSMVSPAMRPEQHGESGTMKVRPNDCICVFVCMDLFLRAVC